MCPDTDHPTPEELLERFLALTPRKRRQQFATVREIARQLAMDESAIRKKVDEGKLPFTRIFSRIYIWRPGLSKALRSELAKHL